MLIVSSDDDEDDDDEEQEEDGDEGDSAPEEEEEEGSGLDSGDSDSEPDLARGRGNVETSSEDEDEEVDDILRREEEEIEHDWGELCKDAPRSDEVGGAALLTWAGRLNGSNGGVVSAGLRPAGSLQHGLGPDEGQRPAGPAELLHA